MFFISILALLWTTEVYASPKVYQAKKLISLLGYDVSLTENLDSKTVSILNKLQQKYGLPIRKDLDDVTLFFLKYHVIKLKTGISNNDLELMARTVKAEAGGESYSGQLGVAAVIVNRLKDPRFPNTIPGIIYAKNQFSVVRNLPYIKPDAASYLAVFDALLGFDPSKGAKFFYNPVLSTDKWIFTTNKIRKIGKHVFSK